MSGGHAQQFRWNSEHVISHVEPELRFRVQDIGFGLESHPMRSTGGNAKVRLLGTKGLSTRPSSLFIFSRVFSAVAARPEAAPAESRVMSSFCGREHRGDESVRPAVHLLIVGELDTTLSWLIVWCYFLEIQLVWLVHSV